MRPLVAHEDPRGVFTELYRESWGVGVTPVQWNAVRSEPRVLRGVHVHARHQDYLTLVGGRASIGLMDLREGSRTERAGAVVELDAARPAALVIPCGVAHGFYFHEPSVHVYAVSRYWDVRDELGCRWDDPDLTIPWSPDAPVLSERDRRAPTLAEMRAALAALRPAAAWGRESARSSFADGA